MASPWVNQLSKRAQESNAVSSPAICAKTGIIKRVSNRMIAPDDPRIFHAVTSMTDTGRLYGNTGPTGSSGAGLTWDSALASAVGEALERYCCAIYDEEMLIVSSYTDLHKSGINAVHPLEFAFYSESQYSQPNFIHHRFTEDTVISWTLGYSIVHKEEVVVPACLVYVPFKYTYPGDLIVFGVTTGLCCARSRAQAILGGLYEVIERDAIMIMWMNRLPCPGIALTSGKRLAPVVEERFAPSGLKFYLNDISTDLPIPVIFATIADDYQDGLAVVVGAAANLDAEAAALKALIEAAQGRRWLKLMKEQKADRGFREDFGDVVSFDDHVRLYGSAASKTYIRFLIDHEQEKDIQMVNRLQEPSPEEAVNRCLDALVAEGLNVIVVDVTTSDVKDLGFCVLKVLIPGLIDINADHNYPLLGGKRLYAVPRRLGYVIKDREETGLNTTPHPFP